jgi:hypothetical protein
MRALTIKLDQPRSITLQDLDPLPFNDGLGGGYLRHGDLNREYRWAPPDRDCLIIDRLIQSGRTSGQSQSGVAISLIARHVLACWIDGDDIKVVIVFGS